ncbi:MAG: hypothetical protein Q9165_000259 [Trypethelium subeluteriae]
MAGELVLITGGSGHLGHRVLVDALKAGYRVRAAVRSQAKADKILATPSVRNFSSLDRLSFAIVPDMLAQGAYDDAVAGTSYIIHVASPIAHAYKEGDDLEATFIQPAVKGTMNILLAARKTKSVKRIVITSSIVAIVPWKDLVSGYSTTVFNEKSRTPFIPGPYDGVFEAYAASKVKALNDTEAWVSRENPQFDIVHVFPAFILGKDELVTDVESILDGTNAKILTAVTGGQDGPTPGASIHLEDVSTAHIRALDQRILGNQGLILSSDGLHGTTWEIQLDIVAKEFSPEVQRGTLPNNGTISTLPIKIDETKSEEILGMKFRPFEEQVKNVVGHYLELKSANA